MSSFLETVRPTPFGFFDADSAFQGEADAMVTYVKRRLGDDLLSVELTNRMVWQSFEQAIVEYGATVNSFQIRSQLSSLLGTPTGSAHDTTNKYVHKTLEFLTRQAEAYTDVAGFGSNSVDMAYIDLETGRQDYNIHTELKIGSGSLTGESYINNLPSGSHSRLKVWEVFHLEPFASQHFMLNSSNMSNFLANEFNYESYVNSTVFYVLPIFEDVLRRGMMEAAARVRRSNYSYEVRGGRLRIFPIPTGYMPNKLWLRVGTNVDPKNPGFQDDTIYGVSGFSNAPFSNIQYATINDVGRWWIREMVFALCMEMVGRVRTKYKGIPIPGAEVTLNGDELVTQARESQEKLRTQLREDLDKLTETSLLEQEAAKAENLQKVLRLMPMPLGQAIKIG